MAKRSRHECALVFGLMCALSLYYTFVVTAGTFGLRNWNTDYYDQLAEGFRAGHLYLKTLPPPELLARANPYVAKTAADRIGWIWDASLYKGHFYIYWGPVPALLLWIFKAMFRYTGTIHDQWLVLIFSLMRLYAGSALIVRFARDHNPTLSRPALCLALLLFAVASPTPFFLARPLIYEACIACGQGFLCLGMYFAYLGLHQRRYQRRWFLAAGSCLGCALGARASLFISAPLVVAATALSAVRTLGRPYPWRKLLAALFTIGTPVGLSLALYGLYNYLRFDSFGEFGVTYQLTGRPFESHGRYILANLFSYFGAELSWSCQFPFVHLSENRDLSTLITWPAGYEVGVGENAERVGGLLVATTISWLWGVWLWRAAAWAWRVYRQGVTRVALTHGELWLLLCSFAVIASGVPAARMYLASMRYLEDAVSGILFGAIAAAFWLLRPRHDARSAAAGLQRRLFGPALFGSLGLHSIFIGVCLGFSGHTDTFPKENAALIRQLQSKLSVCEVNERLRKTWPSSFAR